MTTKDKRENLPAFVIRVPRSANLRYERDVPPDLRKVLGKDGREKRRWRHSLGTGVVRDARIKAAAYTHKYDLLIQTERAKLRLGPEETARVEEAGGSKAFLEDVEERRRDVAKKRGDAEWMRSMAGIDGWAPDLSDPFAVAANEIFEATDGAAPRQDDARAQIAGLVASAATVEESLARDAALAAKLGAAAETVAALDDLRKGADALTLRDVFDRWVKERTPRSSDQYSTAVRHFDGASGKLLIGQIDKVRVREFRDYLAKHCNRETTGNKYLKCLRGILQFAVDKEIIEHNPAAAVKWQWKKRSFAEIKDEAIRSFAVDEVRQLLAASDSLPKHDPRQQDVAWFVRLSLWTGARPEELAQLTPGDIGDDGGVRFLRIHDREHRHVKNRPSVRDVPIHKELIDRGFLSFVDSRRKRGLLFYVKPNKDDRYYPSISKRVARLMRKSAGITDTRAVFYSGRHTMVDCLRLIGTPAYVEDRLVGHQSPGRRVADGYGGAQLPELNRWLQLVDLFDVKRTGAGFTGEG